MKTEKKYIKDFDLDEYLVLKEKADAIDKNMVWHSFNRYWNGLDIVKLHSVDETLKNITNDYKHKIKQEEERNQLLNDYNRQLLLENSELKKGIESLKKPKYNFWRSICFWNKSNK